MNRIAPLIALVFLTVSPFVYCQSPDSLKIKRVTITTSVFDYIPNKLNAINCNLGAEVYLKNRKSIGFNFGIIGSTGRSGGWFEIDALKTKGMRVSLEGKHFINKRKMFQPAIFVFWPHIFQYKTQDLQNAGYYVAANVLYQNTITEREETVADYTDNNPFPNTIHYKQNIYSVNRDVYSLSVKFGYQCIKKYGLTVDYAVGLGAQYISSNSKNRIGTDTDWPGMEKDLPWKKRFDNGAGIYPNFIYQLKLGWAF